MLTQNIKWQHDARTFQGALGISDQRAMQITGSILFEEIDKMYVITSLYDDEDEIPVEFKTKTGVLASVLDYMNNDQEVLFATMEWGKINALKDFDTNEFRQLLSISTMLYMGSKQDRNKFITEFTKRINL